MVLSMGTTNTPYLPFRINIAMRFNFNTIFYVQYRSEEISPLQCTAMYLVLVRRVTRVGNRLGALPNTRSAIIFETMVGQRFGRKSIPQICFFVKKLFWMVSRPGPQISTSRALTWIQCSSKKNKDNSTHILFSTF